MTSTMLRLPANAFKSAATQLAWTGSNRKADLYNRAVSIEAAGPVTKLTSSSTGYEMTARIETEDEQSGTIHLPAWLLDLALKGKQKDGAIAIELDSDEDTGEGEDPYVTIRHANRSHSMRFSQEQPHRLNVAGDLSKTAPYTPFPDTLRKIIEAAATDDSCPVLAGVHIARRDGQLIFEAADGFRMAYLRGPYTRWNIDAIIPTDLLAHISSGKGFTLFQPRGEFVTIRYAIPHGVEIEATTRVIDGEYPDLSQIIPGEGCDKIKLDPATVKEAMAVARDSDIPDLVKIDRMGMLVETTNIEARYESLQDITCDCYAINGRYLYWMVKGCSEPILEGQGEPNKPMVVRYSDLTMVTMPMVIGGYY